MFLFGFKESFICLIRFSWLSIKLMLEKLSLEASEPERSFNCDMSSNVKTSEGFDGLIGLKESRKHISCQLGVVRRVRLWLMIFLFHLVRKFQHTTDERFYLSLSSLYCSFVSINMEKKCSSRDFHYRQDWWRFCFFLIEIKSQIRIQSESEKILICWTLENTWMSRFCYQQWT